tara:strand:- start:201 stop:671 length:471 start_codon:yes stop_codon:yes gene_type:complete
MLDKLFGNCYKTKKRKYKNLEMNTTYENDNFTNSKIKMKESEPVAEENTNLAIIEESESESYGEEGECESESYGEEGEGYGEEGESEKTALLEKEFELERRIRKMCQRWKINRVDAYILIQNVERRQNLDPDKIPPIPIEKNLPYNSSISNSKFRN